LRELPATYFGRVTAFGLPAGEYGRALGRLGRLLRRLGAQWWMLNGWGQSGQRHVHLLLRAADLDREALGRLWRQAAPDGRPPTHYCEPVRDQALAARYVTAGRKHGNEFELLAPLSFRGHLMRHSAGFLVRPAGVLWAEEKLERWGA
jgi:hypothetical protein